MGFRLKLHNCQIRTIIEKIIFPILISPKIILIIKKRIIGTKGGGKENEKSLQG